MMSLHRRRRLKFASLLLVGVLAAGGIPLTHVSAQGSSPAIRGTSCTKVGAKRKVGKVSYSCVLVGKRRIWAVADNTGSSATITTTTSVAAAASSTAAASQCKLSDPNGKRNGISLGFPRLAERLKSTGTVRIGVVFVDFPDAAATRSTQSVYSLISPDAERRYAAMSYGKATFEFVPLQRWLRMSRASSAYSMSRTNTTFNTHRDFITEALNLSAGSLSVSDLDGFVVLANPDATAFDFGPAFTPNDAFWAATAAGRAWMNGATSGTDLLNWGSGWFNHEFGHAMGLVDLYAFGGATNRFVGHFSLMGLINGGAPELFGWERWSLGWLSDSEVACLTSGSATVDLEPIARTGGTKIAVVKLSSSRALVVESRRRLGYDTGLTKEGVVAYVVDTSVRSGEGVIRVLPINDADVTKMSVALGAGESLTYEGAQISVTSSGPSGDRITIRVN
ncbi:MAG: hypothetical protein RL643_368 [Actinomycetota bacterium]|jgi:M6 family metalloprotease-like protein